MWGWVPPAPQPPPELSQVLGTLHLQLEDVLHRVGSPFPSLWGPGGCEGRGYPFMRSPWPQAENFCLGIL